MKMPNIVRQKIPFTTENFPQITSGVWDKAKALGMYRKGASYEDIAKAVQEPPFIVKAFISMRTNDDLTIYSDRRLALHGERR